MAQPSTGNGPGQETDIANYPRLIPRLAGPGHALSSVASRAAYENCCPATDEHGGTAFDKKMHINDLHATMLYLLGLDHEKLTYHCSGRDYRRTDLAGVVAKDIVAWC